MEQPSHPLVAISGYSSRLKQHLERLKSEMKRCVSDAERIDLIKWYFSDGEKFGLSRTDLKSQIQADEELTELSLNIRFGSPDSGKFPPYFREGDPVKVIANAKNTTARTGVIGEHIWHHEKGEWAYLICENGKKVSKRYLRSDLESVQI